MNERRDIEIIGVEHRCDVGEVRPDLIARRIILIRLNIDFDDSTVGKQREMVRRGFVGEAHRMITTHINASSVLVRGALIVHRTMHCSLGAGDG